MNEQVKFLKDIVSIYSPSTNEYEVAQFIVQEMERKGLKAYIDEVNNAVIEIGDGGKTILFAGHIDTVPGEIKVRIEKGKLYGRGSVDAKGPFSAFLMAALKANLEDKKVIIAGCVEEEIATSKGAKNLIGKYHPDYIVIGEPSGLDAVTIGYKGRLLANIKIQQELTHTASSELGVNDVGIEFYNKVKEYCEGFNSDKNKEFDKIQPSLREIKSSADGFIESIDMKLGFRIPVGFDLDAIKEFINGINTNAEIMFYGEEQPIRAGKNNVLVRSFLKAIREHKIKPRFKVKTGTSDMNVLGNAFPDVPILTYGPGDSSLDHTPNEHIDLDEYEKSIEINKIALELL